MQSNKNYLEIKLVASYELLTSALTSQSNSKADHSFKKQMNNVEASALLVLRQRKTYNNHLANKQNGTIRTRRRAKQLDTKETKNMKEHNSTTTGTPTDTNTETTGSQTSELDANTDATAKNEAVATTQ